VCDFLQEDNTTLVWDNEQQVPFAYRDDQWVGFDDERSLRTKVNQRELFIVVFFNDLKSC
jgi:chitinase